MGLLLMVTLGSGHDSQKGPSGISIYTFCFTGITDFRHGYISIFLILDDSLFGINERDYYHMCHKIWTNFDRNSL